MKRILILSMAAAAVLGQTARADWWGGGDRGHDHGRDRDRGPEPYHTRHYMPEGRYVRVMPDDFARIFVGGLEYFFWEGMFYRPAPTGYIVVPAPVGAVVTAIPPCPQPVIVEGVPYYMVNGVTYMMTSYGYQVVPLPRVVVAQSETTVPVSMPPISTPPMSTPPISTGSGTPTAPPAASAANAGDSFTVNIPNSKGGYTAVTLRRSGNGFTGPQGEYYPEFPRVDQLKVMYAK